MPAPSRLQIATSSLERLLKEEKSYHKELEQGEERVRRHEEGNSSDQNAEYILRQERKAVEETKAVFPSLHKRIQDAATQLEQQLNENDQTPDEDVVKANNALTQAKALLEK